MSLPIETKPQNNRFYTYADYYSWNDEIRRELIDGKLYVMSPSPTWIHQGITVDLVRQFANFLEGKPSKVFTAPFDVRLNADTADNTVVQPDVVIICDEKKLDYKGGCIGVPDLMIEVLSPSTVIRDKSVKLKTYLKAGVREYWIVDPVGCTVTVHILEDSKYTTTVYDDESDDIIPVQVLDGCEINIHSVFDQ